MGSQAIQIFCEIAIPSSHNHFRRIVVDNLADYRTCRWRAFSGGGSGGSRWDWDGDSSADRRSRFGDAYECDEEVGFGFRNAAKQRVWWSDDVDAEDDDDEDGGFGILEASIGFDWISKIFQAFGWVIPAVVVSLLMGTASGPDAAIMALALPLAQSAFSLAADALWGKADGSPKSKRKRKKRPSNGSRVRSRARKEREIRAQKRKEAGNYKSWFEGSKESRNSRDFGGWDELDNPVKPE